MPTYDHATSLITSQADLVCFAAGTDLTAVAVFKIFTTVDNPVSASPTFGGASMVQRLSISRQYVANRFHNFEIWTLDGVTAGSNTFSFNFNNAAADSEVTLLTYSGANNGVGATATCIAQGGVAQLVFTSQQSESILVGGGMAVGGDTDPFTGSGITLRTNNATGTNTTNDFGYFDGDRNADTTPQVFGATIAVSDFWTMGVVELIAAASAAGGGDLQKPIRPIIFSQNHYRGGAWA